MLDTANGLQPRIFGVFELNETGTILYSRFQGSDAYTNFTESIVGRNFFEEFADFGDCESFRLRFKNFLRSRQSVDSFHFYCCFDTETVDAEISMTRGHEARDSQPSDFVILDIRKTRPNGAFKGE